MDDFVIVYLNNIIIYLNSKKEYKEYMDWVLSRLYKENILVIIKKCKFYTKKTDFVGFCKGTCRQRAIRRERGIR